MTDEQTIRELRWQLASCRDELRASQAENQRLVSLLGHADLAIQAEYQLRTDRAPGDA
jgi:hypothetical protein